MMLKAPREGFSMRGMESVKEICVTEQTVVRDLMHSIGRGSKGIVLVVDEEGRLQATVTDGDVRRAILGGVALEAPTRAVLQFARRDPVTALATTSREEIIKLMRQENIRQLPILDEKGCVVDLVVFDEFLPSTHPPVQAVIMAGGFGRRLRPLTVDTPKPMLPIAGRPLMERTIERLRNAGIHNINITTHYMPEKIRDHFGDGNAFGVDLNYVSEDRPLGTAGALQLVTESSEPMLVINGDILTQVDYRALIDFHREHQPQMTVAVRQYDVDVPYGVVEADRWRVTRLREKPRLNFLVNAGIYLLEPSVRRLITAGERCDMTELIDKLIADGEHVACFPIIEYWLDIGKHDDFEQAQQDAINKRWAA